MSYVISQHADQLQRRTFFKNVRHTALPAAQPRPLARILVSEDDPAIRAIYGAVLTDHGFEYLSAPTGDGRATFELARRLRPQLLITDVNKPGLDGHALRDALRADPATVRLPILMASALDPWGDPRAPRPGPLDDYLVKPFFTENLVYRAAGLLPFGAVAHDRLVEHALRLPAYERPHPVTGLPCHHTLARGLSAATAVPGWAALGVGLSRFTGLTRAVGRERAEAYFAQLGAIVAAVGRGELLVGHTGFDTQIALVGSAPRVTAAVAELGAAFEALRRRAEQLTPHLPPPHLLLQRVDASAGLGPGLPGLRVALRGMAATR